MILAVEKYGGVRCFLKGIWRILRCNPFSKGGVDYPWSTVAFSVEYNYGL